MNITLSHEEISTAISRYIGRDIERLDISVGRKGNNRATATVTLQEPNLDNTQMSPARNTITAEYLEEGFRL